MREELNRAILTQVEKPARYVGGEFNQVMKQLPEDPAAMLRFGFCFPDTYEIGMSNTALQILYGLLNEQTNIWCERAFAPWFDMEEKMRSEGLLLRTLESGTELRELDIIGFTLQYELCYTNVLNMLDLSGIPLYAKDRGASDPIVCAGGPVIYNPEPMADFLDFVLIGDGEEAILPALATVHAYKRGELPNRQALLLALAKLPSIYVPSLYEASYNEAGDYTGIHSLYPDVPSTVHKAVVSDLDTMYTPLMPLVPNTSIVHDRMALEIFRGCPRGCRFCQAGIAYRPMREKSPDVLLRQALELAANTGYDELGLLSLSISDYACLPELTAALIESFEEDRIALSLPSLRVDNVSLDLLRRVSGTRRSGLTLAPEAGSQRLRDSINKGVTEAELMKSARLAFEAGYDRMKLYFMLGLPGETDEDVLGIADLAEKILALFRRTNVKGHRRRLELTISTALFIPKPQTPFQYAPQLPQEELLRRRELLEEHMPKAVKYDWHEARSSLWEAVLSRGDRRLAQTVLAAWSQGQIFDSWDEHFDHAKWAEAARQTGIDPEYYALRERDTEECLPWLHIDCGVDQRFLKREWAKSKQALLTAECRIDCQACGAQCYRVGICPTNPERNEYLRIRPSACHTKHDTMEEVTVETKRYMRLTFRRSGSAGMLAHLDVMRSFERSLRRARIPLAYSEGFNPRPILIFSLPLSVGLDTQQDPVDVALRVKMDEDLFLERLQPMLPEGIEIRSLRYMEGKKSGLMSEVKAASYRFDFPGAATYLEALLAEEALIVTRYARGKRVPMDIKPLILNLEAISDDAFRVLALAGARDNLRADLIVDALVRYAGLDETLGDAASIVREALYGFDSKQELYLIR